jgi:cyclophilin family peptidyl-prolyl cis-trans isomerase
MADKKYMNNQGKPKPRLLDSDQVKYTLMIVFILVIPIILIGINNSNRAKAIQEKLLNTNAKKYTSAPAMTIDTSKLYSATVKMAKGGEIVIQLYADKAPITVNNFVFLARDGYYNGVTFHRVLDGFMAQGGDPTGTGGGSPGYTFVNENSDLTFDKPGVVAMANAGKDTNGSQFFITFTPQLQLNGGYTIFGQVTSGMDVVNGLKRRNPDMNPNFEGDVIETVTITEQ